jgi:hypothetical protein
VSTKRGQLALPEGWRPERNSSVRVLDSDTLAPEGLHVPGRWRVLDRNPWNGWWISAADDDAHAWLAVHGQAAGASAGFIPVHAQRLVPGWLQLALDV